MLLMGGGARIKKVQRGVSQMTGSSSDANFDVTISPINLTRSFVRFMRNSGLPDKFSEFWIIAFFPNASTIRFARHKSGGAVKLSWEVVEFSQGVRVQHVQTLVTTNVTTATIAPVDMDRTFLVVSFRHATDDFDTMQAMLNSHPMVTLVAPDTLEFAPLSSNHRKYVQVAVVEVK